MVTRPGEMEGNSAISSPSARFAVPQNTLSSPWPPSMASASYLIMTAQTWDSARSDGPRHTRESSAGFDEELDRRPFLAFDDHLRERGDGDEVDAVRRDEPARDGDGLHRLIHRAGADGLEFDGSLLPQHGRKRTSHRLWFRVGGDLEHVRQARSLGCCGWRSVPRPSPIP